MTHRNVFTFKCVMMFSKHFANKRICLSDIHTPRIGYWHDSMPKTCF